MNLLYIRSLLLLFGCIPQLYASTYEASDDLGTKLTLTDPITHIAEVWFAHQSVLMALNAGAQIVATVNRPETRPWMFRVQPLPSSRFSSQGGVFSAETLLAKKVALVFIASNNEHIARTYEQAGIPTARMAFSTLSTLKSSIQTTAKLLHTEQARVRAEAFNSYLEAQAQSVLAKTQSLSEAQRPKVLHIASLHPLKVEGRHTIIDEWISVAGGRNAASAIEGPLQSVSYEQILAWKPDVVIVAASAGSAEELAKLTALTALAPEKVLRNPDGVFPWDRYGVEVALQIQWAAQQLHPELFSEQPIAEQCMAFYRLFFNYALSPDEAAQILAGKKPPQ